MNHIILLLPIISLILFWVLPLVYALPIYLVILVASGLVYYAMIKAMSYKVTTGQEGLIGKPVEIIEMSGHHGRVRVHGEIWQAQSDDILQKGDKARIIEVNDMVLKIAKQTPDLKPPENKNSSN
jgi:membrane protein implicated in regulation of membrane protease activity